MYRQAMWLFAATAGATGCRGEPPNPLEVTVQFERTVRVVDGQAELALRLESEDPPRVLLNLIPYNPRRNSPWPAPEEPAVDEFLKWLGEEGVYAKRRRTKGRTLMGACGQLGSEAIRGRKFVEITNSK